MYRTWGVGRIRRNRHTLQCVVTWPVFVCTFTACVDHDWCAYAVHILCTHNVFVCSVRTCVGRTCERAYPRCWHAKTVRCVVCTIITYYKCLRGLFFNVVSGVKPLSERRMSIARATIWYFRMLVIFAFLRKTSQKWKKKSIFVLNFSIFRICYHIL